MPDFKIPVFDSKDSGEPQDKEENSKNDEHKPNWIFIGRSSENDGANDKSGIDGTSKEAVGESDVKETGLSTLEKDENDEEGPIADLQRLILGNDHGIVEYARDEKTSFDENPLNTVDALILAALSYMKFDRLDGVGLGKEVEFEDAPNLRNLCTIDDLPKIIDVDFERDRKLSLMTNMMVSPRWKGLRIVNHTDTFSAKNDEQFSATTFLLPDDSLFVSFRGTDSTVVGWKEDFMLAFCDQIPSQGAARDYLDHIARNTKGPIYVGGHSKGGNLAVYAAATCEKSTFGRIEQVFDFDGPGFTQEVLEKTGIPSLSNIVTKVVPGDSAVGMLLETCMEYTIVKSTSSGFYQHDAYSWVVRDGDFETLDDTSDFSKLFKNTISTWVSKMDHREMVVFTESLFGMLGAGDEKMLDIGPGDVKSRLEYLSNLNPEMRKIVLEVIGKLVEASAAALGNRDPKKD
ncbi:MAG: Mbeg1-like protein [Coriobacteriales bacterium]